MLKQISDLSFPKQEAFDLYGVVCQQICILASIKESGFISLSEFWDVFQNVGFLDKASLRELLLDLAEQKLLVKDPNRMAFGPSELIHDLRDRDLLWSNIPHSASTVPLVLSGNRIGDINSGNLFTLSDGSVFAFAAKRLKVLNIAGGEVVVTETADTINSKLKFGGKVQPLDLSLVSAVRNFVSGRSFKQVENTFPKQAVKELIDSLESHLQNVALDSEIPFFRSSEQFHYLTFGGLVLNTAISKTFGAVALNANDFLISASSPLDFSQLSNELSEYDEFVGQLDLTFGAETEFQSYLSASFRARENISKWHSESYYLESLLRITRSSTKEVAPPNNFVWG